MVEPEDGDFVRYEASYVSAFPDAPTVESVGPPLGTAAECTGPDDPEHHLRRGLRGVVIDNGLWPDEVAVAFHPAPTVCVPSAEIRLLDWVDPEAG